MAVQLGTISITNQASGPSVIDIEGVIGIPEWWQFDNPEDRVSTYDTFKARLGEVSGISAPAIEVNIRSIGGNVNDALLIHDTLCALAAKGAEITTNCYGYVASAATIIAQAASSSRRQISQNALYLIHRAGSAVQGNREDLRRTIDMLDKTDALIANVYASRSGRPAEEFAELMSRDGGNGEWLTAQEAIAAGLADIITPATEITNYAEDLAAFGYSAPKPTITNKTNTTMKVKATWNAIMNFFGFDNATENNLTDAQLEKLNGELEARATTITDLKTQIGTKDTTITNLQATVDGIAAKDETIVNLKNQVKTLTAENAQLKAGPTNTEGKEDPSVEVPGAKKSLPANQAAYDEDLKAFKA